MDGKATEIEKVQTDKVAQRLEIILIVHEH